MQPQELQKVVVVAQELRVVVAVQPSHHRLVDVVYPLAVIALRARKRSYCHGDELIDFLDAVQRKAAPFRAIDLDSRISSSAYLENMYFRSERTLAFFLSIAFELII